MKTGFCEYCQTEDSNGYICDTVPSTDLIHHEFKFMGEALSMDVSVELGKLVFTNFDYNQFLERKINYCPMCGRKLDHWEGI